MPTVILLHTNDIHGHLTAWQGWEGDLKGKQIGGLDRLASAIGAARKDHPGKTLLLDAGDLLGDTLIADLTEGAAPLAVLNHLGYDALTIGNHEPDFGSAVLRKRIAAAKFPVVAANLIERKGGKSLTKPFMIRKVDGVQVGILGLAYPKTAWTTAAKNVADLEFQEPTAAVKRFLPALRKAGAELIVVLSHLGLGGDQHLAKSVKGIDVIVGGHSHNRMARAGQVGKTLIVQAGAHGSDLGRLDLTFEKGKIIAHKRTLVPLDHAHVASDDATAKMIAGILAPHRKILEEVGGRAKGWLVRAQTLAGQEARKRDEESPVDSLFADILRKTTGSDLGFLPGVGYGVAIPPGPITAALLRQLVPHEGKVVTMQLPGTRVLEVLEQGIENAYTDDPTIKVGGMVQVSGLRFRYDPARGKGHRVLNVERVKGKWDAGADYNVVTNSLLAQGGNRYQSFRHGEKVKEHGSQYEAIKAWIKKNSPVSSPKAGRIVREKATK